MNYIFRFFPVIFLVFLFTASANAEYYKYVDENGKVNYTDDYSKIPKEQRMDGTGFEEYESTGEEAQNNLGTPAEGMTQEDPAAPEEPVMTAEDLDMLRASLEKRSKDLDAEYKALEKEKEELDKLAAEAKTKAKVDEGNKRITAYNEKAAGFQKRNQQLLDDLADYYRKVKEGLNRLEEAAKAEQQEEAAE